MLAAMTTTQPIEIMRPGRHVASNGVTVEFTEADLRRTAAAYAPEKHEAPLVIGHPKENGPAYGWVRRLLANGSLEAEPRQVNPEFAEAVNSGAFKKISTSFYSPSAPANPAPGVWYVRHVGFFGAKPVAVKGMRDAHIGLSEGEAGVHDFDFDDNEEGVITVEFSEFSEPDTERSMSDKDDKGQADFAEREAALAQREAELAKQKAAIEKEKQAIEQQAAEFAEREAKARRAEIDELVERLQSEGRLLPAHASAMAEFMAGLDDQAVIEFAEEGKVTSKPGQQWFREWLGTLPVQVDFNERSAPSEAESGPVVDFAAPPHAEVDKARMEIHRKALAYQQKHDVDYVTAVQAVGG